MSSDMEEIKGILFQYLHAIQEGGIYVHDKTGASDLLMDLMDDLGKIQTRLDKEIYK